MKNLIIVSGHLGSTRKAAELLAGDLNGGAEIYDTAVKSELDFTGYDNYIFGTNVRMFRLNPRFKRYARKLRKWFGVGKAYVYVVAADAGKAERYCRKAAKKLGGAPAIYAGGVLDETDASGFARTVIVSVKEGLLKDGKPLPALNAHAIREFAALIDRG